MTTSCDSFAWKSRSDFLFKIADMWLTNFMLLGPASAPVKQSSYAAGAAAVAATVTAADADEGDQGASGVVKFHRRLKILHRMMLIVKNPPPRTTG